ncbi:hypothetical protein BST46_25295 [Mycobacterium timonense]|nr:hypothetical protein BST19_20245 [Mycobacterium bouchedurhonense]ORB77296.1 hypothetical protein BST46_25295 [Mycobacterium timonense]
MTPVTMTVGQRVKLDHERQLWTVRGVAGEDVAVLTRQAPFRRRGALEYTVLDWRAGVRGPVNVIGQGWDVDTDEQCQQLADLVRAGKWSVTVRNWLPIDVTEVR